MTDYYAQFHPKPRTGKECKKTNCIRHKDYLEWSCGNPNLKFCMECRNAHVSLLLTDAAKPRPTERRMSEEKLNELLCAVPLTGEYHADCNALINRIRDLELAISEHKEVITGTDVKPMGVDHCL